MKRTIVLMLGLLTLAAVLTGCAGGGGFYGGDAEVLTAKEQARRAAALAHPGGPPYTYTWTETVVVEGVEYTKHGQAMVVPGEGFEE